MSRSIPVRVRCALAVAGALFMLSGAPARAQDAFPSRPVRLIVGYGAGNVTDVVARIISVKLAELWNQSVVIENRPGQGGSYGAATLAKAPPDGYTIGFSAMAAIAINPHVYQAVGFDPASSFEPIVNVASPEMALVIDPRLKVRSLKELIAYSQAHPSALSYGSPGSGTVPHLNLEALKLKTGLKALHVPYKTAAAATTDLIGGQIQMQWESLPVLTSMIGDGRLLPVAVSGEKRLPQLPDVPTISEIVPGFQAAVPWLGLLAPAGTPQAVIQKINRDVNTVLAQPDVREKLQAHALIIAGGTPGAFAQLMKDDYVRFGALVKQLGIKAD